MAIVSYDETRVKTVAPKIDGWVEQLFVNFTGQAVRQGDPLFAPIRQRDGHGTVGRRGGPVVVSGRRSGRYCRPRRQVDHNGGDGQDQPENG